MVTADQIQDITNVIVQTVHPKKVYLIGSYAQSSADINSDVDFLIIGDDETMPKYERTGAIQKRLFHYPFFSIDLVMFGEKEIEAKSKNELSFIGHALKTGKLVYES
ncbi:MAG: polymerase, beta domain protein region [Flavisolibacter sp.]|jgi:predicted nucleotidyltransferase|nr:polymerase, beta domain protein region [Flavisolibacter sp.]